MIFINSLFLAFSSSIDSLGIGITYGIKNTKISSFGKIILFFISFFISILAVWFGNLIKYVFPEWITKIIGSFLLLIMGIFICFSSLKKEVDSTSFLPRNSLSTEEKIYSIFIRFLGITIKIIKNPISSDFNQSHSIDSKEALFLGFALSLDSLCIGIGGSMMGISSLLFPFFVSIFQLLFLNLGVFLGQKLHQLGNLPNNIYSLISGILLIGIGIIKAIF